MFIVLVFNNLLLDYMVRAIPNVVIDSWEDLYNTPDIKIVAEDLEFLSKYTNNSSSEMAKNFRKRLHVFRRREIANQTFLRINTEQYINGQAAYITSKTSMIFHLKYLEALSKNHNRLVDTMHLSKYGGPEEQYFLLIPSPTSDHLAHHFNQL